ncbi:HEAT repeat domain-containing protein [Candidatus Nitrospira salsa]
MEPRSHDANSIVPILTDLLAHDPSPDMRRTAAMSLGKVADSNGIPALTSALNDEDPLVREYSAWALGQMETELPKHSALSLITTLGDSSTPVKQAAASALRNVVPEEALSNLLRQVLAISEVSTRRAVVQALTELEIPSSYSIFLDAVKDEDARVRQTALAGLGELADRRALIVFRTFLLNDPDEGVRTEAAFRLGILGGQNDVPVLKKAIEADPTPNVHLWASWALKEAASNPD